MFAPATAVPVRTTLAVIAVAFAVRVAIWLTAWLPLQPGIITPDRLGRQAPDGPRYVLLADNLLTGHGFAREGEDGCVHMNVRRMRLAIDARPHPDTNGYTLEGFRTPGYPLFLAATGGLPGIKLAVLAQCAVGAMAAGLLVILASRLGFSRWAATTVGLLAALHPALVVTDNVVLTECLFAALGTAGLTASARPRSSFGWLLAGLLFGIAGLVRPIGFLYLPTAVLFVWGAGGRWRAMILVTIGAMLLPVAWAARNASIGYGPRLSTVGAVNLYYYAVNYVRSERAGEDWSRAWPRRVDELTDELQAKLRPGDDLFTAMRKSATAELAADPVTVARVATKSQIKLIIDHSLEPLFLLYDREWKSTGMFSELLRGRMPAGGLSAMQLLPIAWVGLNAAIAGFAVIGAIRLLRRRHWRLCLALVLPVLLFSAATFPVGLERYRLPFLPFMLLLAVAAIMPPSRSEATEPIKT